MNILRKVTWKAMWGNKTRTIVTIIGVILSAAMFTAVTTMGISMIDYLIRNTIYYDGDYYATYEQAGAETIAALEESDLVSDMGCYQFLGYLTIGEDYGACWGTAVDEGFLRMMPVRVIKGRLPENSGEIVVTEAVYDTLAASGQPVALGEEMTAALSEADGASLGEMTGAVVGVIENCWFGDLDDTVFKVLTIADGSQPEPLWQSAFVKTGNPRDAFSLEDAVPGVTGLHTGLLRYYGATGYDNINSIITGMCLVLIGIIMAGSVSLIHNAFSISVSERTKQFGLLSSIGATRKQIRGSVLFEAAVICLIGIPIGLICGYFGIAVTLYALKDALTALSGGGPVEMYAVAYPVAFAAAAVVAAVTVLLSAWFPARRAGKITPVEAIRQTRDHQPQAKAVKVGKLAYWLFGLPGVLAKKYYKVSRKKYRSTIVSLAISVVLFLTASAFSQGIEDIAERGMSTTDEDFLCAPVVEDWQAVFTALRSREEVVSSAYYYRSLSETLLPVSFYDSGLLEYMDSVGMHFDSDGSSVLNDAQIYYYEDAALAAYLKAEGIDPAPYLDGESPLALVCDTRMEAPGLHSVDGSASYYFYGGQVLSGEANEISLFPEEAIGEALVAGYQQLDYYYLDPFFLENGLLCISVNAAMDDGSQEFRTYVLIQTQLESGGQRCSLYPYDLESETMASQAAVELEAECPVIRLGQRVSTLPLGVTASEASIILVLPYSARPEAEEAPVLGIQTSDTAAFRGFLEDEMDNLVTYIDFALSQENSRRVVLLVNVFSYGFIILISLICVANVFNTISTNIALRRRDFGMLRSVGLKSRELYRMMSFECLLYGFYALLAGLPLGLLGAYGCSQVYADSLGYVFQIPWAPMLIAACTVFLVVFITMFYAVTKLRRDTPMEAIRMDSI